MAALMLFKSCVGLAVYTYPYAFSKVGIAWGIVLSALTCYATTYGMYAIAEISDDIENPENDDSIIINDYRQLSYIVINRVYGQKYAEYISAFTATINFMLIATIIIASLINISNQIHESLNLSVFTVKICILAFYLLMMVFVIVPEQIKVFGFVSAIGATVILALMMTDNFWMIWHRAGDTEIRYDVVNLWNTGQFLTIAGSSYESIGTLLTVRSAMKHKSALPKQIIYVFIGIGILYSLFSLSFYFAYGKDSIISNTILFYPETSRPIFYTIGLLYSLTLILFIPLLNIANSEQLQEISIIKSCIEVDAGELSVITLVVFRWLLLILTIAPAMLTNKIEVVLEFSGSLVVPFISFYIPVTVKWTFAKSKGVVLGWQAVIHDSMICMFGTAILVLGLMDAIANIVNK